MSARRTLGRAIPIAAALLLAAAPAAAQPPGLPPVLAAPPDDVGDDAASRERLLGLFMDGVLRSERQRERALAKWTGAVVLSLRGAAAPYVAFVQGLADELRRLTRLTIEVSTEPDRVGDLDVYLAQRPGYWPFGVRPLHAAGQTFTCAAAPSVLAGVIRRSRVEINAADLDPGTVRACLLEEIVQSLGLLGEVASDGGPADTILRDDVGFERLGIVDRLLLRALYDPRLAPGLDRDAARPLVALILGEQLTRLTCAVGGDGHRRCDVAD